MGWKVWGCVMASLNTLRPRQNGRHFPYDIFICIFFNENDSISIKISLKFVPKGLIYNIPALVQIMDWHRTGDKPLSETTLVYIKWFQWISAAIRCLLNDNIFSFFFYNIILNNEEKISMCCFAFLCVSSFKLFHLNRFFKSTQDSKTCFH